jgi:hypothetical protein
MPDENPVMQATAPSAEVDSSLDAFMASQPAAPTPAAQTPAAVPTQAKPAEAPKAAPAAKLNAQEEADRDMDLSGAIDEDSEAKIETPAPVVAESEEFNENTKAGRKAFREAYARNKGELDALRRDLEAERAKSKSQQSPEEIASLKAQIAAVQDARKKIEAERDAHAKELERVNFLESPTFKQKFTEPWKEAQKAVVEELSDFTKQAPDGTSVPIEWSDIEPILRMKTPDAIARSKELIGDSWDLIMSHRRKITDLEKNARTAMAQHETLKQQYELEQADTLASAQRAYESEVSRLSKDYPDIYTPATDNPREAEQFTKGSQLADAVLLGKTQFNKESGPKAVAIVRQRAAMFPVVAIRLKGALNEVAQLKAELETFKNSGPGGGVSGVVGKTESTDELGDSLDQFKATHKSRY